MRAKTLATLTLMTLLVGCGDDPPGSVITPDASGETGADGNTPDGLPPPPPDGTPPPPPDGAPMDDVPPPPQDVPPGDAGVDAVDMDVPPPPDGGMDVPIGMDTPPPPDADGPDVPGPDVIVTPDADGPDVPGPDVIVMPDVPMGTEIAGHRATALVSNGAVMRSPSYRMVSTLGQSSIHQTVMRSLGFRLRGGLVGATGGSR